MHATGLVVQVVLYRLVVTLRMREQVFLQIERLRAERGHLGL